jgi:hypothetical protein
MKYALFIAEKPSTVSTQQDRNWANFLGFFRECISKGPGDPAWGEGVALCRLEGGLGTLADLVKSAREYSISSRTIFFEERPEISYTEAK